MGDALLASLKAAKSALEAQIVHRPATEHEWTDPDDIPAAPVRPIAPAVPAGDDAVTTLTSIPAVPLDVAMYGDKLCGTCKKLEITKERFFVLPGNKEYGEFSQQDSDITDLGPIAAIGERTSCPLCRLVYVAIGAKMLPTEEDGLAVHASCYWATDGRRDLQSPWINASAIRVLRLYAHTPGNTHLQTQGFVSPQITMLCNDAPEEPYPGALPDVKEYFVRLRKPGSIDFDRVRRWIGLCNKHHTHTCRTNPMLELDAALKGSDHKHPADVLPEFRCIDVARMCLALVPAGTPYAALSYVWGRRSFFCTLRANVKELEQPGSLALLSDHLPQTIQDALCVAREVGQAYLWIDTLCIVQDDNELKGATIKRMDMVYCAADLVIIAAGSPHAYAGIAGVRPGGVAGRPRQAVEQVAPGLRLAANEHWQDGIKDASYYQRGWTLQENYFAWRSLVFINGTVVFRCAGADAWEEHIPESTTEIYAINVQASRAARRAEELNDIGSMEQFMNAYSECILSFGSDLYNAFAGMARQLMVQYNTDLCHGMPTRFFDWHLLWEPQNETHHVRCQGSVATGDGRGPSWSWSGWTGGAVFAHIWDWYTSDIGMVSHAIRKRTWIVWYQRKSHRSSRCTHLVRHMKDHDAEDDSDGSAGHHYGSRNLYGERVKTKHRFPGLDCSRRKPTPVCLSELWPSADHTDDKQPVTWPPKYIPDTLGAHPGSGFLQFWTVSILLQVGEPVKKDVDADRRDGDHVRLGIFGRSGTQISFVYVEPDWVKSQEETNGGGKLPQTREFILLCEARDERAPGNGNPDKHKKGWKYAMMMLEWVTPGAGGKHSGQNQRWSQGQIGPRQDGEAPVGAWSAYAERVAIACIGFGDLGEALGDGPVWKEIILG
ncbi:hypothetical protein SCUCBS95973_006053 [Sporothrix curviconia]|uniref:Heterokaryon incompatibility domain-containing protein n=1 Tax=Sporothrix curviconia TaxID=1260050 RepID=A0ABP0C1Z8_9PEZI